MRTYYIGNMEFGEMTIGTHTQGFCLIHELAAVKEFTSDEEAEAYAEANSYGDWIRADIDLDEMEITFSAVCIFNGSIEVNPMVKELQA